MAERLESSRRWRHRYSSSASAARSPLSREDRAASQDALGVAAEAGAKTKLLDLPEHDLPTFNPEDVDATTPGAGAQKNTGLGQRPRMSPKGAGGSVSVSAMLANRSAPPATVTPVLSIRMCERR